MRSSMRPERILFFMAVVWILAPGHIKAGSPAPVPRSEVSPAVLSSQDAEARVRSLYFTMEYAAGVAEGEKLIERFPESSELRAWYLLNEEQQFMRDQAIEGATALTVERPSDPWSWFALAATSWIELERRSEALKLSRKALAMAPDHPDFLWLRATSLYYGGRSGEAMDFVAQVLPRVSNPAALLTVRGDAILDLNAEDEVDPFYLDAALQEYQKARRADPRWVMAYTQAAIALAYFGHKPQEALPLMEKAVEIAPCSLGVHQRLWATITLVPEMDKMQKQSRLESDIQALLDCRGDDPEVLRMVARQYGRMKLAAKQSQYQDRVLRDYPDSVAAEWVLVDRWRVLAEEEEKEGRKGPQAAATLRPLLQSFINRPQHRAAGALAEAYMSLFGFLRDDPTATGDELLQAVNGVTEFVKGNYPIVYVKGPNALADRGAHLDRAEELVLEGISKSEERRKKTRHTLGGEGWRRLEREQRAEQLDALGWVHLQQGRVEEAKRELVRASKLAPPTPDNVFHLGRLAEKEGDLTRAQELYTKGLLIQTPDKNPSENGLKGLYIKVNGSDAGYEKFRAQFQQAGAEERKSKILAGRQMDPQPLEPFDLKSLDGRRVSSSEVSGKIAVVNFWGLWCGWCLEEMPDIQKLHEKYRSDPKVLILTIDTYDEPEKVRDWMKQRNYDFPVLLDDGYVSRMEIKGFPTTWFVDERGRKAFILQDWSKWLVEEYGWRIEALKNDGS